MFVTVISPASRGLVGYLTSCCKPLRPSATLNAKRSAISKGRPGLMGSPITNYGHNLTDAHERVVNASGAAASRNSKVVFKINLPWTTTGSALNFGIVE